jgi:hypothetical protein
VTVSATASGCKSAANQARAGQRGTDVASVTQTEGRVPYCTRCYVELRKVSA